MGAEACYFGSLNSDVTYIDADSALLLSAGSSEVLLIDVAQLRIDCSGNPVDSIAIDSDAGLMDIWTASDDSEWLVVTHPDINQITIISLDTMSVDSTISFGLGSAPSGVGTTTVGGMGYAVIALRFPTQSNSQLVFLELMPW